MTGPETGPDVSAAVDGFRAAFGAEPSLAAAPGRINLIGDHTDYNDGHALPVAIDRHTVVAFRARTDGVLRVRSLLLDDEREARIESLRPGSEGDWFAYVAGVIWAFRESGGYCPGLDLLVAGDLPIGCGLSSSASLELAVARAAWAIVGAPWRAVPAARLCQRAENRYVGVRCGVLDQLTCAAALPSAALLIDCRSLETRPVPIPETAMLLVMDTAVRRQLTDSAYNARRQACERAVARLRATDPEIRALRDLDEGRLSAAARRLDPDLIPLVRHVVQESARPLEMERALVAGDLERAGRLMNESHVSLRDLYRVSSPELDLISDLARRHPACYGARMTGAGFAGCAIALVQSDAVDDVSRAVQFAYREQSGKPGVVFACRPVGGVRLL